MLENIVGNDKIGTGAWDPVQPITAANVEGHVLEWKILGFADHLQ
jgi:hypothetical protein